MRLVIVYSMLALSLMPIAAWTYKNSPLNEEECGLKFSQCRNHFPDLVGKIIFTNGTATANGRDLQMDSFIYAEDFVKTGDPIPGMESAPALVIKFDDSVLQLSASSEIIIDDYVYNPKPSLFSRFINFGKGVLRFLSIRSTNEQSKSPSVAIAGTRG